MLKVVMLSTIFSLSILGQNLDQCGLDNNPELTQVESEFLNEFLGFDFMDKKVVFVTGSNGTLIGNKIEYFDNV